MIGNKFLSICSHLESNLLPQHNNPITTSAATRWTFRSFKVFLSLTDASLEKETPELEPGF